MERKIDQQIKGYPTTDGAGVHLVRVLGPKTVTAFDPFLMLDSFDSENPADYTAGFPMHPHRGIETISFLSAGAMTHRDSLGKQDTVTSGEVQWMTAGSGILHEELLPAVDRMLGIQLWLNMPANRKMSKPGYHAVKSETIKAVPIPGGTLRLLAGHYHGHSGHLGQHLSLDYYDLLLEPIASLTLQIAPEKTVMLFTLKGDALVTGEPVTEKTAVLTTPGESLTVTAGALPCEILVMISDRLGEPVAWDGPIVMNTREELNQAFDDLNNGTFIRQKMEYDHE